MWKPCLFKRGTVLGIILLFIFGCCMPGLTATSIMKRNQHIFLIGGTDEAAEKMVVTCVAFGKNHNSKQTIALSQDDASMIFELLRELKSEMMLHPFSEKTQSLKRTFVDLLDEKGLLPQGVSKEVYLSLLNPRWVERLQRIGNKSSSTQPFTNSGTCTLCSVGGEGSGVIIPLVLLPRPRIAMLWDASDSVTTAANLLTSKGYIAWGAQTGFTLGFIGIGIFYVLPGYTLYGFIGYALLASTTAEYIEHYPPNRAPEISDVNPADNEQSVPLSLTKLQFRITDPDGDLMSYTVTTNPDIGSASENLKRFGMYTVPISGLQDLTKYTWHIQVTDGKDTTEETLTFTTEAVAPIISNPLPADGERDVPMDTPQLQFTIKDYQGDAMEYTMQTSPNIGSDHKVGVHDGTYSVPVSGITYGAAYRWFVNATDGTHWTRKVFNFETGYPSHFDPFEFGWNYRKQITINHTKVVDDLENFPVLISTIDPDLMKAQDGGGDILFMNGPGVAIKLHHEIETFDQTTGNLVAWVNVSALSSSQDTVLYMYYGNPTCINQQCPEKTWDSSYLAVWHMNDATPSTISDGTSHAYIGTKTAANEPIQSNSKIGYGQNFDGSNDKISVNTFNIWNTMTVTFWFKTTATAEIPFSSNFYHIVFSNGFICGINPTSNDGYVYFRTYNGDLRSCDITANDMKRNNDVWYFYTATFSGGVGNLYINASLKATSDSGNVLQNSTRPFYMGYGESSNYATCHLDEFRISSALKSTDWITTEFNNQNNPSGFLSIGPEKPHP